jgi:hypothetical protein
MINMAGKQSGLTFQRSFIFIQRRIVNRRIFQKAGPAFQKADSSPKSRVGFLAGKIAEWS